MEKRIIFGKRAESIIEDRPRIERPVLIFKINMEELRFRLVGDFISKIYIIHKKYLTLKYYIFIINNKSVRKLVK